MKLSNITVASLQQLTKLAARKEHLIQEIAKIEAQMAAVLAGQSESKTPTAPSKKDEPKGRRRKRGSIAKTIIAALQAAGPEGLQVNELSHQLGIKSVNLHAWFAATGKKHAERIGRGRYRLMAFQEKPAGSEPAAAVN